MAPASVPSIRVLFHALRGPLAVLVLLWGSPSGLRGGQPAPALEARDLQGKPFVLAGLKGKVVLVDFWASWCGPCRKSLPFVDQLQAKYGTQGFQAVGVSLDEEAGAIATFLERTPLNIPLVSDPSGASAEAFKVVAMPTAFLLDREGRIVARFEGGEHLKAEEEALVALLQQGIPPASDVRVAGGLQATGRLKAWRRGHLADPIMNLDGDRLSAALREHIHASKEGAAGHGGAAGGGCGCN